MRYISLYSLYVSMFQFVAKHMETHRVACFNIVLKHMKHEDFVNFMRYISLYSLYVSMFQCFTETKCMPFAFCGVFMQYMQIMTLE